MTTKISGANGIDFPDSTNQNSKALGIGYMLACDQKSSGTPGGASVTTAQPTAQTRALNTVVANTIAGASLSANQVTLPAGTYRIKGSAPALVDRHQVFIYNVTDSSVVDFGRGINGTGAAAADPVSTISEIETRFTLAATKVIELRHFTNEAKATDGLGSAVSSGLGEKYAILEIVKES